MVKISNLVVHDMMTNLEPSAHQLQMLNKPVAKVSVHHVPPCQIGGVCNLHCILQELLVHRSYKNDAAAAAAGQ